jgi:hypothetical protein
MSTSLSCPAFLMAAVLMATVPDKEIDPATLQDKVMISVGKELAVQFQQDGDSLSHPKVVEKPTDAPPTLSLDFRKQGDNLILTTKNPFRNDLKFRAAARLKDRKEYFETSIVPVKAGLLSFELWRDPIEELVLFDFELIDGKP